MFFAKRNLRSKNVRCSDFLQYETLELRRVLAPLTIITHGFQFEDTAPAWAVDMGVAISDRADVAWTRQSVENAVISYQAGSEFGANAQENLIIFDWSPLSRTLGAANEDNVAGRLAEIVRDRLPETGRIDVHFIGHSRGSYVNNSVIERLTAADLAKIGFLQQTTLDPQNAGFDGVLDVPSAVDWSDNYFQTTDGFLDPSGFSLDGADVNIDLTDVLDTWDGRMGTAPEHSEVHDWYHWTIDLVDNNSPVYEDVPAIDSEVRNLLYDSLDFDMDLDGTADLHQGGQKIGFHYSLGDSFTRRTFAGFGAIDIVFVIDTTGSMADDIAAVQSAAGQIVDRVATTVPDFQIGVVAYEDFPVSPYGSSGDIPSRTVLPMTSDRNAAINAINTLDAAGGGDYEEAVYTGLMHAIDGKQGLGSWRGGIARKVIILMGDAPPHDPEPMTGFTKAAVTDRAIDADPVDFFTVAIGSDEETVRSFERLAKLNGGEYFNALTADEVVDVLFDVIDDSGGGEPGGNQAPVITRLTNSASGFGIRHQGETTTITGIFEDHDLGDSHLVWVNWGDGIVAQAHVSQTDEGGTFWADHIFTNGGRYNIRVTVQDIQLASDSTTTMAYVVGAGLHDRQLQVLGTHGDDDVTVKYVGGGDTIRIKTNFFGKQNSQDFSAAAVDEIYVETRHGNDLVSLNSNISISTKVYSGRGDDIIYGGQANDYLYGGHGNDVIVGRDGDDLLRGGYGSDQLFGYSGNDRLLGGPGNDKLFGGAGDDFLTGHAGHDMLFGEQGHDFLLGGLHNDKLVGGQGDDDLRGNSGNDEIHGGAGNDLMLGGADEDYLVGSSGDDRLFGNAGNDLMLGNSGDDFLNGGDGFDKLIGGAGLDELLFGEDVTQ